MASPVPPLNLMPIGSLVQILEQQTHKNCEDPLRFHVFYGLRSKIEVAGSVAYDWRLTIFRS